jgi:hypothetical protein
MCSSSSADSKEQEDYDYQNGYVIDEYNHFQE